MDNSTTYDVPVDKSVRVNFNQQLGRLVCFVGVPSVGYTDKTADYLTSDDSTNEHLSQVKAVAVLVSVPQLIDLVGVHMDYKLLSIDDFSELVINEFDGEILYDLDVNHHESRMKIVRDVEGSYAYQADVCDRVYSDLSEIVELRNTICVENISRLRKFDEDTLYYFHHRWGREITRALFEVEASGFLSEEIELSVKLVPAPEVCEDDLIKTEVRYMRDGVEHIKTIIRENIDVLSAGIYTRA